MSLMLTQPMPGRSDAPEAGLSVHSDSSARVCTHTCTNTHTQSCGRERLLHVGMRGSPPSLIPVELSTAHPAECVSIAAGHAVRGTVCVSHELQGRDF